MKTTDLCKLKELLIKYQADKCKMYSDGGCYKLNLKNGDTEQCPVFAIKYDSKGGIIGGSCAIDWLKDDLRSE